MKLLRKLLNHLGRKIDNSHRKIVMNLAEMLVNELEPYENDSQVQSITIWFDYDHMKKREISVEFNDFECKRETGKANKHYKA